MHESETSTPEPNLTGDMREAVTSESPVSPPTGFGRIGAALRAAERGWFAAAVVCLVVGVLASAFGARGLARSHAAEVRQRFARSSSSIAATLSMAVRHEEQLTVSASTFFAGRPDATIAEFARWKLWARIHRRYPELDALGFLDSAHATPALARARDAASAIYSSVASSRGPALAIVSPVYRGASTPLSVLGRRAASVGWLREVLIPGVVLGQALVAQEGYGARMIYHGGAGELIYARGMASPGAQSASRPLRGGWSATVLGPPVPGGVFAAPGALAVLVGGVLVSVLLALLVLVLGGEGLPGSGFASARRRGRTGEAGEEGGSRQLHDELTGLPGATLMLDRAERLIARTGRQSEAVSGALFVEVDSVADVGERLGGGVADQLLEVVARRLEQVVRSGDSVGRLGGEEFLILVESSARGVRLDSLARRVIEMLREPVELEGFGPSFVLSARVGIAFGRYETPARLLDDAQSAARAAGKNRYKLFNANTRTTAEGHELLEGELNAALEDRQLFLLYEPICDLRDRGVIGLQAQIRWRHPERGVLEPPDFMALARESGLIVPLGRWQLERACTDAAAWNVARVAGGQAARPVGVSVRVASEQLNRDGFLTDVRRALQQSGLEASLLTLDISEITAMGELAPGAARLHELDRLGVRIALDDFGSRYASHIDLAEMPLDFLKVDRRSVAASETDEYRRWLLETTLLTGRELGLPVIVRGIATLEQLEALRAIGASIAQGEALGTPAPAESVGSLLAGAPPAPAGDVPREDASLAGEPPADAPLALGDLRTGSEPV